MTEETTEETTIETAAPAFLDGIETQYHSAVEPFTDKNSLAKGYSELSTKMGTALQIPTSETTPDEVTAFYQKLGVPPTKDGYDLKMPELPEGLSHDEKFEMTMRGVAHEAHISQEAMKKLFEAYNAYRVSAHGYQQEEGQKLIAEGDKALHEKWGVDYPKNFEIQERACVELIPDEELRTKFGELITAKGLRNNPVFAEVFLGIGMSMLDDTLTKGSQVVNKDDYVPANPKSPEMYEHGDDDESKKARAHFRAKGHVYATKD